MKFNEDNTLWLADSKLIMKGKLRITNLERYHDAIQNLRNLDHYVIASRGIISVANPTFLGENPYISLDGAFAKTYTVTSKTAAISYSYLNPLINVMRFMNGQFDSYYSLLSLFSGLEKGASKERQLENLKIASSVIHQLQNSNLSSDTMREVIKRMWPNFGYFVTEGLACMEFKTVNTYQVEQVKLLSKKYKEKKIKLPKKVRSAKKHLDVAEENGKVYSLALSAHKLLN